MRRFIASSLLFTRIATFLTWIISYLLDSDKFKAYMLIQRAKIPTIICSFLLLVDSHVIAAREWMCETTCLNKLFVYKKWNSFRNWMRRIGISVVHMLLFSLLMWWWRWTMNSSFISHFTNNDRSCHTRLIGNSMFPLCKAFVIWCKKLTAEGVKL